MGCTELGIGRYGALMPHDILLYHVVKVVESNASIKRPKAGAGTHTQERAIVDDRWRDNF